MLHLVVDYVIASLMADKIADNKIRDREETQELLDAIRQGKVITMGATEPTQVLSDAPVRLAPFCVGCGTRFDASKASYCSKCGKRRGSIAAR